MMSKIFITLTIVFMAGLLVSSYFLLNQESRKPIKPIISYQKTDKARPRVEAKSTFADIGQIKVSEQKEVIFTIKNNGERPLQVTNISSSCSCTVGKLIVDGWESEEFAMHSQTDWVNEIAPSKEAKVKVIYRPYVMPVYGVVEREVYVTTNDPDNQKLVFRVKSYVN